MTMIRSEHRTLPDAARRHAMRALVAIGLAALAAPSFADDASVTLEAARSALETGGAVMIDIREPVEHANGVAPGARLLPMSQIGQRLAEIPADPARPVLLICNTQNRSSKTLRALRERGYAHLRFVEGGMSEWARRGWPLVKPGL